MVIDIMVIDIMVIDIFAKLSPMGTVLHCYVMCCTGSDQFRSGDGMGLLSIFTDIVTRTGIFLPRDLCYM